MGGYATYVWSAWGLTALIFLYLFTHAKWQSVKIRREIKRQIAREDYQLQRQNQAPTSHRHPT